MQKKYFITGISTDVGKTIVSAILTEALQADYWKPIQAGDLSFGDKERVRELISNSKSVIYNNSYQLKTPMSPHAAADIDGIRMFSESIIEPQTENHLIIEGAGGLLVPINNKETIADLIKNDYEVILVSRHYLGSINHTLLSFNFLMQKGIKSSILFVGDEHPTTEAIIKTMTNARILGRIPIINDISKEAIYNLAQKIRPIL